MTEVKPTAHDALSAMPGDTIVYDDPSQGINGEDVVITAGWLKAPKGGKVWTYETQFGARVPNHCVIQVIKKKHVETIETAPESETKDAMLDYFGNRYDLLRRVDKLEISPTLKVVIHCLIEGDTKNLEVAEFLIGKRLAQLKELETATNNP